MKYGKNIDSTFDNSHTMSFGELYDEISADFDKKIAKFQARAAMMSVDEDW